MNTLLYELYFLFIIMKNTQKVLTIIRDTDLSGGFIANFFSRGIYLVFRPLSPPRSPSDLDEFITQKDVF